MGRRSLSPRKRWAILKRDNFTCVYCGAKATEGAQLHVDHRIAVALGGGDDDDNLVAACELCNLGKADTALGPVEILADDLAAAIRCYDYRPKPLRSMVRLLARERAAIVGGSDARSTALLRALVDAFLEMYPDPASGAALSMLQRGLMSGFWLAGPTRDPETVPAHRSAEYRLVWEAARRSAVSAAPV